MTEQTFTVSVSNSAPTANFANTSGTINTNGTAMLAFTGASDLGSADTAAGFLYSYDCTGDQLFEITDTTLTPVSYTHLDVYKRQPMHCAN